MGGISCKPPPPAEPPPPPTDLDTPDDELAHWQINQLGFSPVTKQLKALPPTTIEHGRTLLHRAAGSGKLGLCRWLFAKGVVAPMIHATDVDGHTPLHHACFGHGPLKFETDVDGAWGVVAVSCDPVPARREPSTRPTHHPPTVTD